MKPRDVILDVSDHAILPYIERVIGADVDAVRQHLQRIAHRGAVLGAPSVRAEGVRFLLRDGGLLIDGRRRVHMTSVVPYRPGRAID